MSVATSFYTTFQQVSLTLGIAVSAAALAASLAMHGHTAPLLGDFSAAFLVVAGISALAPLISLRSSAAPARSSVDKQQQREARRRRRRRSNTRTD